MFQKAGSGVNVRLLSAQGEVVAWCGSAGGQPCTDMVLPEFRSLRLRCPNDILVGELLRKEWAKFYFNNGYLQYWEKRLEPDAKQGDQVPTDHLF